MSNHKAQTWDHKESKPLSSKLLLLGHHLDGWNILNLITLKGEKLSSLDHARCLVARKARLQEGMIHQKSELLNFTLKYKHSINSTLPLNQKIKHPSTSAIKMAAETLATNPPYVRDINQEKTKRNGAFNRHHLTEHSETYGFKKFLWSCHGYTTCCGNE